MSVSFFREDASEFDSIFLRMGRVIHVNTIIGHRLVFMGYGHWLGNDIRGSGSTTIRAEKFEELGSIHFGRKEIQPPRDELREFFAKAEEQLDHERIWFNDQMLSVIAEAFGDVVKRYGYTAWAGAVLQNHAHDLIRVHRDNGELMWERLAVASRDALRGAGLVAKDHPVWSNRPYDVFKKDVRSVRKCIGYINDNFTKHKLPRVIYPWITAYDGFPFHKK